MVSSNLAFIALLIWIYTSQYVVYNVVSFQCLKLLTQLCLNMYISWLKLENLIRFYPFPWSSTTFCELAKLKPVHYLMLTLVKSYSGISSGPGCYHHKHFLGQVLIPLQAISLTLCLYLIHTLALATRLFT